LSYRNNKQRREKNEKVRTNRFAEGPVRNSSDVGAPGWKCGHQTKTRTILKQVHQRKGAERKGERGREVSGIRGFRVKGGRSGNGGCNFGRKKEGRSAHVDRGRKGREKSLRFEEKTFEINKDWRKKQINRQSGGRSS